MWFMNQMGSCFGPRPVIISPGSWVSFLALTQGWDTNHLHLFPLSTAATKTKSRDLPGGPVVKTPAANAGAWVQSLVRKLRSHMLQFSSVAQSCLTLLDPMDWSTQASLSTTPRGYSNSCPSSQWCHPTISFSVIPFSSHLQSFLAAGSFPMSQLFASDGQRIEVSASASVLPMNIQDWFPLGWTGWLSLQSKRLSGVFSNTTVQRHQFFSAQLSLWFNSHIHTWPLEKS